MFRISDFSLKVDQNLTLFHVNCTEVSYNVTKCVLKMASLGFWKTILAGLNHSVEQNIPHIGIMTSTTKMNFSDRIKNIRHTLVFSFSHLRQVIFKSQLTTSLN